MISEIRKRDGIIVPFQKEKVFKAISKAFEEARLCKSDEAICSVITEKVIENLPEVDEVLTIEAVQSSIISTLLSMGFGDIASVYSKYRDARNKVRDRLNVVKTKESEKNVTDSFLLLVSDGKIVSSKWDRSRIIQALEEHTSLDEDNCIRIAKIVENRIVCGGFTSVTSSFIRELVNTVLMEHGFNECIKDMSVYRIDKDYIDSLMNSKNDENSNFQSNNPEAVSLNISGYILKEYALDKVFGEELAEAHRSAKIHIHDLDFPHRNYCSSHSVAYICKYGLVGLENLATESSPAKSASVLTGHINTFLASMQAYYAGALGLAYLNIFYAPYVTGCNDKQLYQIAQELIFNASQNAFSRGASSLFLDFNIHPSVPHVLRNTSAICPGGVFKIQDKKTGEIYELEEINKEEEGGDIISELVFTEPVSGDNYVVQRIIKTKNGCEYDPNVEKHTEEKLGLHVLRYADFEDEVVKFAEALLQVWMDGDKNGRVFPFPKCDFHYDASVYESDKYRKVFEKACELSAHNGSTYFVFDKSSTVVSACCFEGNQEILLKGSNKVTKVKFKDFKDLPSREFKGNLTFFHNGAWVDGKYIEVDSSKKDFYRIKTVHNKEMTVTEEHQFPTYNGLKYSSELTEEDYLEFTSMPLNKITNHDQKLTYNQGYLIGLYLGDGSEYIRGNCVTIHFSLNKEKYNNALPFLRDALDDCGIDSNICLSTPHNNVYPVNISSVELHKFIRDWVFGKYSHTKELNLNCLLQSVEFRQGIIDGMYASNGGNSNRIYSTSSNLISQLEVVFTSLGLQTIIDISDTTDEPVVIRDNVYKRNYPLYCIRWYNLHNRRTYPNLYKIRNNSVYFKISEIENMGKIADTAYCLEMKNQDEPYFTLPNGVITHNCRLKTTIEDKSVFIRPEHMSFCGFQNVTVNIPQAAYRSIRKNGTDIESFLKEIDEMMGLAVKAHLKKREFIKTIMYEPGTPLYQVGKNSNTGKPYIDLDSATHIIGLIGLDDAVKSLTGYRMHENEESFDLGLKIVSHMFLKTNTLSQRHGLKFTLEETPAESAARRLACTDLNLFPESKNIISGQDNDAAYYTNSIHFQADADVNLVERIRGQSKFHSLIQSGAIIHAFIGEHEPSPKVIEHIVQDTFERTQCAQLTFSPELTYCNECGNRGRGFKEYCERCNSTNIDNVSRVVGYFSKIQNWNKSKRLGELKARQQGKYI